MRESFLGKYLLLLPVLIGLIFYGCVEEPTIAPVKPVYSAIRVVNLSDNVNNMKVTIDGKQPVSSLTGLGITSTTDYFDIDSGKRDFKVYDGNGDLVYEKTIELIAFQRSSIVFAGFSSSSDLERTFNHFTVDDGLIYVSSAPKSGNLNIYFVNAASEVDTFKAQSYNISATYISPSADTLSIVYETKVDTGTIPLAYGSIYTVDNAAPGSYSFNFAATDTNYSSTSFQADLSAGYRYYIFIYGQPDNIQIFNNEVVPPPIRSRD
jgi:Domain of unknown function (DUF4397)